MPTNVAYTEQYLREGHKETVSLKNLYDTILITNSEKNDFFRVPYNDFFLKYRRELEGIIMGYSIPESYYYKPKLLSLELYGTTELWLSILRVNNMRNISEFNKPVIRVYNPNQLKEYINIFFKREKIIT